MTEHLTLLFILPLLTASAFFSASEAAIFSVDPKKLFDTQKKRSFKVRALKSLLDSPRKVLVTILVGKTLMNIFISILAALYTLQLAGTYNWNIGLAIGIQVFITALVILIIGELSPKVFASRQALSAAFFISVPLYWINILLFPFSEVLSELSKVLFTKLKFRRSGAALTHEEIHHLTRMGHEKGTIDEDEHDLIRSVVESKSIIVREIMTHRTQMVTVASDISLTELIELLLKTSYSRIPVYKEDIDHIIGVLYAKDILLYLNHAHKAPFNLHKILRRPLIVPETKFINDLMKEFQEKKLHLAVVVDEYGGTAGIVTLEDIIEEVIGELRDEMGNKEDGIVKQAENMFLVQGSYPYREFCEYFCLNPEDEESDYDTLAGWILKQTGHIPKTDDAFALSGYHFTIRELSGQRIQSVLVRKLQ